LEKFYTTIYDRVLPQIKAMQVFYGEPLSSECVDCRIGWFRRPYCSGAAIVIALVDGVTAAAIGAITGAVIVLARRSLIDPPTVFV
jgi:hypothetical protein